MELLTSPDAWLAFVTLTVLELVLGIDNVIFIAILVDKLPVERREITRRIGLLVAMVMRVALLFLISWIVGLTAPLFTSRKVATGISNAAPKAKNITMMKSRYFEMSVITVTPSGARD
mgnify:CR=1 FL=1